MPEQSSLQHDSGDGDGGPPEDKSESEVEASECESAEGFRVSVDLSAYWGAPAACLVWVGRAGRRRVRWLARRVRRAALLRRPFCLLCGARALPPAEPLRMLRSTDQLRVVPVEHEWQRAFSFPADASLPDPVSLPEPVKKKHKSSQIEPEELVSIASSEPIRKHKSSRGERESTLASSESTKEQSSRASTSPKAKQKRRKRNTLTETSPPHAFESEMQTEPTPVESVLESDDALERVKRRALALLQQVEERVGDEPDGCEPDGCEPDGWPVPTKKRRRRVRRRRAPPPLEPLETSVALSPGSVEPSSPAASPGPPASPPAPPPLPRAPPAPPLVRNPTPPRPPRLVRPLPAASAHDTHNTTEPERAPSPRVAPPAPPAVQCN